MSRRTVSLTVDRLDDLGAPCRACTRWQLDPVRAQRVRDADTVGLPLARSEVTAWTSMVLREWGSCGRVALVGDVPVGHVLYAPEAFLPGLAAIPTAPASSDAVVMAQLWVDPAARGGGIGRLLVQGMARDLIQRGGVRAVETYADTRGTRSCRTPVEFCHRVGFRTQRAHSTCPRMRMDLRSALTWRDEVEQALERLWGAVRPLTHPAPEVPRAR